MAEAADRFVADRKGARVAGVLLSALGIFLLVSLATHSPLDPPSSSQIREGTFNWAGRIGAYLSYGAFTAVGLAAYVWTRVLETALEVSERLEFGLVGVNDWNPQSTEAPFGGMKLSGFGGR